MFLKCIDSKHSRENMIITYKNDYLNCISLWESLSGYHFVCHFLQVNLVCLFVLYVHFKGAGAPFQLK